MITKIKLVNRKDGTSYYADESGKFFDPFAAPKGSFTVVGEVQESEFRESASNSETVRKPAATKSPAEILESTVRAYQFFGLTESEARQAAELEGKISTVPADQLADVLLRDFRF